MLKQAPRILIIFSIIFFPISRYFGWNSSITTLPVVYIALLLVRPFKIKYFIYDALIVIALVVMHISFFNNFYILAYTIMAVLVGGSFILAGIGLYRKYYGIEPFDE